jgi:glycosyltransferase involved in cell wall biosynthesis
VNQNSSATHIAYLAGQYPEVSLTFILREVEALRGLGLTITTCSIRRTPPVQHPGPAEKAAAASTFVVLDQMRKPLEFLKAQGAFLRRPGRYVRALELAWRIRAPGLMALMYQLVYFLEATVLARHLQAIGVRHIHNHFTFGSATVAMLVNVLTDIPYSFTLHGPADLLEPYRWRLDEKIARARFVAVISHYARSQAMFFSDPAHWHKLRIIHCGVMPDRYAVPAGEPLPPRKVDETRLLFVGRLAPVKGLRVLLAAMADLKDQIPGLHLVLAGDGPDRKTLEAVAAPLGDMVTFTGYLSQDEVARAMQSCDVFVLPSFAEGVPVVLMEAFASGKPVIATQVAGVGELVEDGVSGLLTRPGDTESLGEAILALAIDRERRRAMADVGAAKVRAEFDIVAEATRLATLFAGDAGDAIRPEAKELHTLKETDQPRSSESYF